MKKAFENIKHNVVHLTFLNGNSLSTIWGAGTYSDNYDFERTDDMKTFMGSNTVEVMIMRAPDKLKKSIERKFDSEGDGIIGHLTMEQWLYIVKRLSK